MAKFKLFGRDIVIGKDLTQYQGTSDDFWGVMQQKYGVDYTKRNKLEAYKGIVYGCLSLIGEQMGDYKPYLERKVGDQWQKVDHEFIDLLNNPAGRDLQPESFSKFDLFEASSTYELLQGDVFWYMALGKTTGRPRQIVLLRADKVGTDIDPNTGQVNGYFIRQDSGATIPLETNEVLRFRMFNPRNPYQGLSGVEAGSDYIATDEATAAFTKNFMNNNASVSGVLTLQGEITKGAFRKFVRAWKDKYQGVQNAGKVAILRSSDASFEKIGLGLDELDMTGLRKMSAQDVAMIFKVPLELLGRITEGSGLGRGNIETLEYIFAKYNIDKKMTRFDAVLQFALQRYYGLDPSQYRVDHENVIPEDKEFELAERTQGVDKWLTRDEIRAEEGLDNAPGGDQLFVPINNIPLDDAGMAPTPAPAAASTSGIKVHITRTVKKKARDQSVERFRLSLMRTQLRYEKRYRKQTKPIFAAQRRDVLANIEAHGASLKKDFALFDDSSYDNQLTQALTPVLNDLASVQGGLALSFAGDTDNEFLLTAPLKAIIQSGTHRMAQEVNDLTIEKLNQTLTQGVREGEGLSKLKGRVNDVFDNLQGYRSERIARTETLKASNSATNWAYKQSGFVTAKVWVVNPDACPQCEEFDGKSVGLDDSFLGIGDSYTYTDNNGEDQTVVNSYDTVEQPPLHPNCRCTIIPDR